MCNKFVFYLKMFLDLKDDSLSNSVRGKISFASTTLLNVTKAKRKAMFLSRLDKSCHAPTNGRGSVPFVHRTTLDLIPVHANLVRRIVKVNFVVDMTRHCRRAICCVSRRSVPSTHSPLYYQVQEP